MKWAQVTLRAWIFALMNLNERVWSCVTASLSSISFAFSKNLRSYVSPAHGICARILISIFCKFCIAPPISITVYLPARKDYSIQRIGVGLARWSWAGVHSLFLAGRLSWIKYQSYSFLIAASGLNFIALSAGKYPATIPINIANAMEAITSQGGI